ncbi:hypothetical protein PORY_002139 [Pneumocystis oryctolagi]|uniref:Uncharacterized protein n=1 Tax=Pneumocystis oryctolagi TaxID=42067 RepID=A0ACB7CH26_9ASCO|nr:hypothetical protein PORY_002139 [Pneumocystis oryctolagi]
MCFRFFNDFQEPLDNKSAFSSLSSLNKNIPEQTNEETQISNGHSDSDFYDQFFWKGMPIYMGKLPRSVKLRNNTITLENMLDIVPKELRKSESDRGTLMSAFEINYQNNNGCIKRGFKSIFKESDLQILHNEFFEETDIAHIFGKDNFNSLNGKLKTIPENESLHCFHTELYRRDFHI